MRRTLLLLTLLLTSSGAPAPGPVDVRSHLDRYAQGDFDAVARDLDALTSYDELLEALRRDGPVWIDAVPEERNRRRLTAATYALEAARAADHVDWKKVRRLSAQGNERGGSEPEGADRIFWQAPSLLVEWGCALLRSERTATPVERIWHLASIAVAQRAGDPEFLIGSPFSERMNAEDEIEHAYHVGDRFKQEGRFKLAVAIALDASTWTRARGSVAPQPADASARAFQGLLNDDAVGGEAAMRLGALHARRGRVDQALEMFERAETRTRDRYVIYLARYFKGQALERASRLADAEAAYRAALATIPQAQSATIALAAVLSRQGARAEASRLIEAQLGTSPAPADPWAGYGAADDRFWPYLITRLRAEITR